MKYFTRDKSSPVKQTSKKQLLQRTASSGPGKHHKLFSMWLRKRTVIISLQDEPELVHKYEGKNRTETAQILSRMQSALYPLPYGCTSFYVRVSRRTQIYFYSQNFGYYTVPVITREGAFLFACLFLRRKY